MAFVHILAAGTMPAAFTLPRVCPVVIYSRGARSCLRKRLTYALIRYTNQKEFVRVWCDCCGTVADYPFSGRESIEAALTLFDVNRGRSCRCLLARDLSKWVDTHMLHKRKNPTGSGPGGRYADDDGWKKYPSIIEFLTASEYAKDEPRVPGTILLFADDGVVKVCFTDKDTGYVAFTSLDSVSGSLKEIETLLAKDDLDWRKSKWSDAKGKRPK